MTQSTSNVGTVRPPIGTVDGPPNGARMSPGGARQQVTVCAPRCSLSGGTVREQCRLARVMREGCGKKSLGVVV